jgi:RNase P/RNase MRP subunit p29
MKKLIASMLLVCTLVGCSGLAAKVVTSAVKPKAGIEASVNGEAKNQLIGQKTESVKKLKTGDNAIINDVQSKTISKVSNAPWWLILIACVAVPDLMTISKGFIKIVKLFRKEL